MAEWQSKTNFQSDRSQAASLTAADFVINVLQLFVFRVWGEEQRERDRERATLNRSRRVSVQSLCAPSLSLQFAQFVKVLKQHFGSAHQRQRWQHDLDLCWGCPWAYLLFICALHAPQRGAKRAETGRGQVGGRSELKTHLCL